MIHILLMEFNTELILLSGNISSSVILSFGNTSYININCHYYNNTCLYLDSYFGLNDYRLFSYIENIESSNSILNIIKNVKTDIKLSFADDLLISKKLTDCYIGFQMHLKSYLVIYNALFLSKVNLFINMHSNVAFKSIFSKGCLIPKIYVKSNLLVKYYNIIPRLVYNLIKINKRLLYFNNNFLSKKND